MKKINLNRINVIIVVKEINFEFYIWNKKENINKLNLRENNESIV